MALSPSCQRIPASVFGASLSVVFREIGGIWPGSQILNSLRNRKMTRYVVLLLLLIPSALLCQTGSIRGQVTDARSGEPLIGANVVIVGSRPGHGAASDMNGMFRMNKIPPGEYVVKVTYIDYETLTLQHVVVEAGKTAEANFALRKEGDTEPTDASAAKDPIAKRDSAVVTADSVKQTAKE